MNRAEQRCYDAAESFAEYVPTIPVGDRNKRGRQFEDTLAVAMDSVGLRYKRNQTVSSKCADMDFLIETGDVVYGVQCKASVRERWRQADRDFLVAEEHYRLQGRKFIGILLTMGEGREWTDADTRLHRRLQGRLLADGLVIVGSWNKLALGYFLWKAKEMQG